MDNVSKRGESTITSTIVIPVYNEEENVILLVKELSNELKSLKNSTEILFVDDNSTDNTRENVLKLIKDKYNVRYELRENEKGLSSAVIHGFKIAKGTNLVCMDGDLQHPPSAVVSLIKALNKGYKMAIGTRYYKGSTIYKTWTLRRILVSKFAQLIAYPLCRTSDPMSGIFAIKKNVFYKALSNNINAKGFKIGLELYVKSEVKRENVHEVGYDFRMRRHGHSKLNPQVVVCYIIELLFLYIWAIKRFLNLL